MAKIAHLLFANADLRPDNLLKIFLTFFGRGLSHLRKTRFGKVSDFRLSGA
jgi:hypothetical protein